MECERVREEFVERLTGTLDPERSRAIDQHIAGCAACRAETDRLGELWGELGTLRAPAASGAAGRVSRLIEARAGTAAGPVASLQDPIRRIAVVALALAASLVIGIYVGRSREVIATRPVAPTSEAKERYVLFLRGPTRTPAPNQARATADSAAERAIVAEYRAWAIRLRESGSLVIAEKLADDPLTLLSANAAAEMPRNTADELGGFFLIQAADSAEAFRIARECPHLRHGGTIEVRRIEPT
jgi:hypothetical protein